MHCEKEPEAIKDCIRRNENVSITLYRGDALAAGVEVSPPRLEQPPLPLGRGRAAAKPLAEAVPRLLPPAAADLVRTGR